MHKLGAWTYALIQVVINSNSKDSVTNTDYLVRDIKNQTETYIVNSVSNWAIATRWEFAKLIAGHNKLANSVILLGQA